ncbi:HD domain-containing protein [Bradyrhizobium sp. 174]|uniref:HD domain-containing protein n=1 Tax=Bradyrhizobium sp. 174 TaxID=2782645 RepID=UPI001FFA875C|nr:HD domain-containing protein [Bradyrhizobium sp. 174]MCK1573897.1 HD domain-containing protein [Bradyrhizobium sp. 174]
MLHIHFPHPTLAQAIFPYAFDARDGAHDEAHLLRVWRNVAQITHHEGGDTEILVAATILHDCVWIDKASPERGRASSLAAEQANKVLSVLGWPNDRRSQVCHSIEAHSFSAGIPPISLEAKILQDADRLDAIGWIGIARCLYLAGTRRAAIYHFEDPTAARRKPDDISYALDHFQTKLFGLADKFCTATGRKLAAQRSARLHEFYSGLLDELGFEGR